MTTRPRGITQPTGGSGSGSLLLINPLDAPYSAVGDGITDDTAAFQAAFDAAKTTEQAVALPAGHIFSIGAVNIRNGVRGFYGFGGTLKLQNISNAGIRLLGQKGGELVDVSNCTISGLRIDANNNANSTVCIWGQNISDCKIFDNTIVNVAFGWGILVESYTVANPIGGGNRIQRNKVFGTQQLTSGTADWYAIGCYSEAVYSTTPPDSSVPPAIDMWRKTFTGPTAQTYSSGNLITDNRVVGGYYGFYLLGTVDSVIANNSTQWNVRGFSLQNNCVRNTVVGNYIFENHSAGIHLAFGSSENEIKANTVYTSIGVGEALIQAYIGCQRNRILNNTLTSYEGTTGSQHGIYVAIHADDNVIQGNIIRGRFKRAAIAVSSAWNAAATETYRYAQNSTGANTDWLASAPTSGVVIRDNTIYRQGYTYPAILLDQATTHAGVTYTGPSGIQSTWDVGYTGSYAAALTDCIVKDNTIIATSGLDNLRVYEDTASNNNGHYLQGNKFDIPVGVHTAAEMLTYFVFPRGRAHFLDTKNNFPFDSNVSAVTFPAGVAQDVSVGKYFSASGVFSQYSSFTGGIDGQEITVRLDNQTGITNTSGGGADTIRLKNGRNIAAFAADADWWLNFRRQGGVWFETHRSTPRKNTPVKVTSSTTICPNGGAYTKVTWPTVALNAYSEWASNTFTVKLDGLYQIQCKLTFTGTPAYAVDELTQVDIYINGSREYNGNTDAAQSAGGHNVNTMVAATVELVAGNTIEFYVFNNCTGGSATCNGVAQACWATITKID